MTEKAAINEVPGNHEMDIQSIMLRKLIGQTVTAFLINGMRMVGMLTAHDRFTIMLDNDLIIYKHAITTIQRGLPKSRHEREHGHDR